MNYLLIFCYTQQTYFLVESAEITLDTNCEVLFEFDASELRIARKVMQNLQREQMIRESKLIAA